MQKSQLSKARWPRQMRTSTSVRSVAKVKSVRRYLVATLFVNHAQNVLCKRKNAPCAAKRRKDIKIFIFRNIVNTEISNKKNTFKSSFTFALFNTIIFRHFLSFTSRSSDLPNCTQKLIIKIQSISRLIAVQEEKIFCLIAVQEIKSGGYQTGQTVSFSNYYYFRNIMHFPKHVLQLKGYAQLFIKNIYYALRNKLSDENFDLKV